MKSLQSDGKDQSREERDEQGKAGRYGIPEKWQFG